MPIKGLTDRGLALPEIGQIRKGAKKDPAANRPGADLTYFRVEFAEGEEKAAAQFAQVYGQKPNAIRVILPFNEIERMWDAWKEAYTAGRMVARSDGEYISYQLDNKGEVIVHNWTDKSGNKVPHPQNDIAGTDYKGNPVKFKNTGRLKVIIPELSRAAYLTVMTTSTHDIGNISDQLGAFKELNHGQLAGIPFILRRRAKMVSMPKPDGTRVRVRKFLISIEVDPDWAKAKFGELNALALPEFEAKQLPSGEDIQGIETEYDEDDEITVDAEQPESINQEIGEASPAIELIDPMGKWAVEYAAKSWNVQPGEAATSIASKKLGKQIDKRDFIQIVNG